MANFEKAIKNSNRNSGMGFLCLQPAAKNDSKACVI
jgi:hypothetical protein